MICYLDMDGVLCNWSEPVAKAMCLPYPPTEYRFFGDDKRLHKIANEMSSKERTANLEWMPDGKEILALVKEYFDEKDIYILTTPRPNPDMWAGKALWIWLNMPSFSKRLIQTTAPKHLLANKDTVLVDDYDENVHEFRSYGRDAILVPRPWNSFHLDSCVPHIKSRLEDMKCSGLIK